MKKIATGFLLSFALAGCLAPSFTKPVDTNLLVSDVMDDGQTIKGRFDPAGFSNTEARRMAGFSCKNAALATFGVTDVDGQKVFQATCRDGTVHGAGAGVNFTRTGAKTAKYSSVFNLNGQLTIAEGEYPL